MRACMIDLETLGVRPGSTLLSLGAVMFSEERVFDDVTFYHVISRDSCREAGLSEDPETLLWWEKQPNAARDVIHHASYRNTSHPLGVTLKMFSDWWGKNQPETTWSLGADFDLPLLGEAYRRCGFGSPPWAYSAGRCLRTLRALRPAVNVPRSGTAHNALDDALTQAALAVEVFRDMRGAG